MSRKVWLAMNYGGMAILIFGSIGIVVWRFVVCESLGVECSIGHQWFVDSITYVIINTVVGGLFAAIGKAKLQ